jgi:hypothetical protein
MQVDLGIRICVDIGGDSIFNFVWLYRKSLLVLVARVECEHWQSIGTYKDHNAIKWPVRNASSDGSVEQPCL